MNRLVLLCCGALIAASLTTAGASAAKVKSCKTVGMAAYVQQIQKRGVSCADARIVIRSVEAHGAQCKPDKAGHRRGLPRVRGRAGPVGRRAVLHVPFDVRDHGQQQAVVGHDVPQRRGRHRPLPPRRQRGGRLIPQA
jgi:hypothetical protein